MIGLYYISTKVQDDNSPFNLERLINDKIKSDLRLGLFFSWSSVPQFEDSNLLAELRNFALTTKLEGVH